jgi:hypothetical protein
MPDSQSKLTPEQRIKELERCVAAGSNFLVSSFHILLLAQRYAGLY